MNLRYPLLLLFLSACTGSLRDKIKSLLQFGNMIRCIQPNVSSLRYNRFGCYCGYGGAGRPVDEVDRCCETHDHCYGASLNLTGCTNITDLPYVATFKFTCSNQTVTCSDSNDNCEAFVCECDRAVAQCFAESDYNKNNSHPFWRADCTNTTDPLPIFDMTESINDR